ncbi:hypothetical protein J4E89_009988 [Alternaria sp. Ai002NY15]|nr:hypothetical protein J4E89_009988 [Alternaria sp. Ai002NY15]
MRFTTPIKAIIALAASASLPLLTTAQMGPDDTICGFLYGTDYTDACCHTVISRGEPAYPASGPLFGHGPSGIVSEYMTLEDLEQVYWDYFSSNAMGETMAKAVAAMKNA